MEKTQLFSAIQERIEEYRDRYPKDAERDLKIARLYSQGVSFQRIATEMIYEVTAVKRAIKRIKTFLSQEHDANSSQKGSKKDGLLQTSFYISPAIARGRDSCKSVAALKLFLLFITRHQDGFNDVDDALILKLRSGLKNKERRAAVLEDLNSLTVQTAETPSKCIKIFEYVTYSDHRYSFELTEAAYPYFYPLYFAFGRHPLLSSLLNH